MSDDRKTTPPTANNGATPACSPTASCASGPCRCGDARWVDTQAYCGDSARIQATLTGNCPDGPATIEILHPTNGSAVDTINSNLRGGRVDAVWVAKTQTAGWRTERIRFRVSAAGQTCPSSNEFTFRQRPTTAWILRNINRGTSPGFLPICEKVDAQLEANRLHYSLKVKLTGTFTVAQQSDTKTRIETIWNDGFSNKNFHRTRCLRGQTCNCAFDCCKAGFHLDFNWVASGQHYPLGFHPGATSAHSGTSCSGGDWADPPIDATTSYAHETGHFLGQFDEYTGGATDPSGVQPVNPAQDNLMKTAGDTTLFNRHFRWALEFLNANSGGDPYEIIPP